MCPGTIIRISRIQLLCRIIVKAPDSLVSLIKDTSTLERGWASAVIGDLKWLTLSEKVCHCADFGFIEWCDYIKVHFKSVKRDAKMFAKLRIANLHESRASAAAHECAPGEYACEMCQCKFNSFQKLSLHRFKKHNAKNVWRLYAAHHTHCCVCLQQFWSRERLLNHLRYRSKICKYNV